MKTVLPKKRSYNYKDVLRVVAIFIIHYLALSAFTILLVWAKSQISHQIIEYIFEKNGGILIIALIISPGINALMHIIYAETGHTSVRGGLWIHATFWMITIPTLIFLFV